MSVEETAPRLVVARPGFRPEQWTPEMVAMLVLVYAYAEDDTAPSAQLRESAWAELHELDRLRWLYPEGSAERLLVTRLFGIVEVAGGLVLEATRDRDLKFLRAQADYDGRFVRLSKTQALSTALKSTIKLCAVGGIGILLTKLGLDVAVDADQKDKAVSLPYLVGLAGASITWFATELFKSFRATQFTLKRDRAIHEAKIVFQRKRLAAVRMAERTARNALLAYDPGLDVPPYAPVPVLLQAFLAEDLRSRPADPFTKVAAVKLRAMAARLRRRPGAPAKPPEPDEPE